MYDIKDGNKIHFFTNREDIKTFEDYKENGLKVIRRDKNTIYFNDFSRLSIVSMPNEKEKRYVLRKNNGKTVKAKQLINRYIAVAEKSK